MLSALISCADPKTWSSECRSPDGMWIASAFTIEHGGFANPWVETIVEIKRANHYGSPEQVLGFDNGGSDMKLRMRWDTPTHLSVVYDDDPKTLYYQVAKTSGIDISVQDLLTDHPHANPPLSTRP
jgi:hypothetical protein